MMKRLFILFTIFLSYASTTLQAQDNLPQNFSISLGGGVTLPRVEGNRNDFFSKNGDRAGYNLMTEGRYYFMPNFALGLQYDYLRVARLPDKMHLHYIHPNITYRYLWSEGNQGAFLSFGMGYEFYITKKLSGVFRADILTADWFANPDARLSNPYDYDDGIDHSWFKNNVTFFNLGFAIQFGR